MEAILKNVEQGINDGLAKTREANTVQPLVVFFPAQCECGHLYLERYMLPKERGDGCVAFCWCGFCQTRRDVFKHNNVLERNTMDDALRELGRQLSEARKEREGLLAERDSLRMFMRAIAEDDTKRIEKACAELQRYVADVENRKG